MGRLGVLGIFWFNRRIVFCIVMKKFFIFWRRKYECFGFFLYLFVSRVSIMLFIELGYDFRDKDFKKFFKVVLVRDLEKVKEYFYIFSL